MASVTCYGRVSEIGGNELLLSVDGTSLFLDFVLSFGAESRFFEEYLQPCVGVELRSDEKNGEIRREDRTG